MSGRVVRSLLCLPLLALLVSCGVGGDDFVPGFEFTSVGAAGGEVEAGEVLLIIPGGALSEDTAVAILPQRDPLTISATDGCIYTFLGNRWCCGPIGLDLAVPGRVRLRYDDSLVPAGFREDDLVLLLWNDDLQVLEPDFSAIHDTSANTFETNAYTELGHLAVGVRDCSPIDNNFIFSGVPGGLNVQPTMIDGNTPPGVFVGNVDGAVDDADPIPAGELPRWFLPSPDGTRLLFPSPDPQTTLLRLFSVPIAGGTPVLLAGQTEPITEDDPLIGWLEGLPNEAYLVEFLSRVGNFANPQIVLPGVDQSLLARVAGDGSQTATTPIHGISAVANGTLTDMRQSPNGQQLMLLWERGGVQDVPFERLIDIVQTSTGAVLSTALVPRGQAQTPPRFMPNGQEVLVVTNAQQQVEAYSLDASQNDVRFDLGNLDGLYDTIEDVVPLLDGTHIVVLVRGEGEISNDALLLVQAGDPGTVIGTFSLDGSRTYDEIFLHPDGDALYLSSGRGGIRVVGVNPSAAPTARFTPFPDLPVPSLSFVDINARNGALLLTVPSLSDVSDSIDLAARTPQAVEGPGVCITDRFGQNIRLLDVTQNVSVRQARWVFSVRRAPGMSDARIR